MDLYDADGNYALDHLDYWDRKGLDPAWPGHTPEPAELIRLHPDLPVVPVARSFVLDSRPVHVEMIREMVRVLPERELTAVVGHGRGRDWMAMNAGSDGHGSWSLSRDLSDDFYSPELIAAREARGAIIVPAEVFPERGDAVEVWLKARRNAYVEMHAEFRALDELLDEWRERSDYGLSLTDPLTEP